MELNVLPSPAPNQFQGILFGPGYGESILIHIGSNNWIIIDSCISSPVTSETLPVPIEYLQSIGVDPSTSVSLVIATHWHDDHIRGMSKVVEICESAEFCCSMALSKDEFISSVYKFEKGTPIVGGSGSREIVNILEILKNRRSAKRVVSGTRIKFYPPNLLDHGEAVEIWSLTPSEKQIELFLNDIAKLTPKHGQTRYRSSPSQNHSSLALWISIGDLKILLGGDLEETNDPETGWSAAISSPGWNQKDKALIFTIPHHGSITGHSDVIWKEMISQNNYSILTPFNRGKKKLPSESDKNRLLKNSNNVLLSQCSKSKPRLKRSAAVEKMITQTVGKIRTVHNQPGKVSIIGNIKNLTPATWNVSLLNGACQL